MRVSNSMSEILLKILTPRACTCTGRNVNSEIEFGAQSPYVNIIGHFIIKINRISFPLNL